MADRSESGPKALPDHMLPGRSALGRVIRKAERLLQLGRAMRPLLPENLRDHVTVADLDTGHLSLLVSSSARATQLRFQQRLLETQIESVTGEAVVRISVAVKPRPQPSPKNALPAPPGLPAAAAAHVADMARDEPDAELKEALERLARRTP